MRRPLLLVKFEEMKNKSFEVVLVVHKLCEFCDKPISTEERTARTINISDVNDYNNLFVRARAHDRVEVNVESGKIYFYDHDYPGDAHPQCVEEYVSKK
jgi:hypothetical protein